VRTTAKMNIAIRISARVKPLGLLVFVVFVVFIEFIVFVGLRISSSNFRHFSSL